MFRDSVTEASHLRAGHHDSLRLYGDVGGRRQPLGWQIPRCGGCRGEAVSPVPEPGARGITAVALFLP